MLKTVLLLDGSEAVNSSSDYLPTRLLALRPQLNAFVHAFLDDNPLASLGVVVMRDGVAHRLISCTANATDIAHALELKYFLFGGSGAMSLENGLRMALSELVDLKRIAKRVRREAEMPGPNEEGLRPDHATQLRVILVASSVTLVDPHDVFRVQKVVAQLRVRVDVVSFCGAVHALQEAALTTGGQLYTPMNYEHLTGILQKLAAPERGSTHPLTERPAMIQIGFPRYVEAEGKEKRYMGCPQCGLIQTSVPSTCPLCKLLLCSAPLIHTSFITKNEPIAPSQKVESKQKAPSGESDEAPSVHCSLCCRRKPLGVGDGGMVFWRCSCCLRERCDVCEAYVKEGIGLCPTCVASS
uniref:Putative DNA repair and transcription factor protein n=1 Tax=Trypanosoma congolense (strain IL3000) TaxID=1068625 RepID=G0USP8_TRYCI|nr:putative DNA repair and transcription factor protein [Trypanosoma congolense IL3000]